MQLGQTKRIILNIIATYARSVFAMVCGIFTGRWVLMSLGEIDYGLFGVIGGLMVFVAFLNSMLGRAIGRFYAYSIGEAGLDAGGLEKCREWFNSALFIHTVIPVVLIVIGYPAGVYMIRNFLTIPPEKIEVGIWVWRYACITGFVGMISVPYSAMYTAKQYIAELSIYGFAGTLANVFFVYYMVTHPGEWLAKYALGVCLISVIPQLIICVRAHMCFAECRVNWQYIWNVRRIKEVFAFVGWQFFGDFGSLMRNQGIAILVNKMFGPIMNTTMGIGNVVAGHACQLSGAMNGAFYPAVTTLAGKRDNNGMLKMAQLSCKYSMLLTLFFVLPLVWEMPAVLELWLKNPPPLAAETCLAMLLIAVIDSANQGCGCAVTANGRIALYYFVLGMLNILMVPIAGLSVLVSQGSFYALLISMIAVRLLSVSISGFIAQKVIGFSVKIWFFKSIIPVLLVTTITLVAGYVPHRLMSGSLLRLLVVVLVTGISFCLTSWFVALSSEEKTVVKQKFLVRFFHTQSTGIK